MLKRAALACLLLALLAPATASAAPAEVGIGKVRLAKPVDGRAALLVPVRYPIQLAGRVAWTNVRVELRGGVTRTFRLRTRVGAGAARSPERRQRFSFVHAIELGKRLTRLARRQAPRVSVLAWARVDADGNGRFELRSRDRVLRRVPARAGRFQCETLPRLHARPGRRLAVDLPRCGGRLRWTNLSRELRGRVRIRGGRLLYWPPKRYRGSVEIRIAAGLRPGTRVSAKRRQVPRTVEIKVGTAQRTRVRAIGDSVTAGFGYYDNGKTMPFTQLLNCKPAETFYNDACSSNSASRSNTGKKVEYAPDYGLANNVSWAAQWANEHGISDYKNLAVTGSEPSNWLPGGQLYATLKQVESEDPDYILMTMGANPLLSEMLFGVDKMGCAIWADILGEYTKCIEEAFAGVDLRGRLKALYSRLVKRTEATIFLMRYHLSVPSSALAYSATQIATMGNLLNREIASVAAGVGSSQLRVVTPPHFGVGIDISPAYPSTFSCSRFGYKVDGRSVQSTPTQDELAVLHPLSFCSGPPSGPPWVISGDTGIHPSAAGYAQMAGRVPAPRG